MVYECDPRLAGMELPLCLIFANHTELRWPQHQGFYGNEKAQELVRRGSNTPFVES